MKKVFAPRTEHTISIITVTKNNLKGLTATFESITSQTFAPLEWIVIDGSEDSEQIKKISPLLLDYPPIKYYRGADTGIYNAMNKGLSLATSAWVHFLNSGDRYIDSDTLRNLNAICELRGADVIVGHAINELTGRRHPYKDYKGPLILGMFLDHQAALFRTALFESRHYDEGFKIAGDFDLCLDLYLAGASFEFTDLNITIKDFVEGRSSNFFVRQGERIEVLKRHYEIGDFASSLEQEYKDAFGQGLISAEEFEILLARVCYE